MAVRRLRRRCDTISNIQLTQPLFASSLFTADYIGLKPHAHTHTCTRTPPYTLDNHLGAARIKVSSLRLACINYRTSLGIFMKTQRETHCGTLLTKSREPEHIIIIAPAMRWRPIKKKSCAACEDDDDISDTTLFICIACVRACSRSHCTRSMLPIFHIHHNTRSLSVEIMQHIAWHCLANSWNDTTTVKESQLFFFSISHASGGVVGHGYPRHGTATASLCASRRDGGGGGTTCPPSPTTRQTKPKLENTTPNPRNQQKIGKNVYTSTASRHVLNRV